jgi:hypothetical protein
MIGMSIVEIVESRQLKNALEFYRALTLLRRLIIVSNCNRSDPKAL